LFTSALDTSAVSGFALGAMAALGWVDAPLLLSGAAAACCRMVSARAAVLCGAGAVGGAGCWQAAAATDAANAAHMLKRVTYTPFVDDCNLSADPRVTAASASPRRQRVAMKLPRTRLVAFSTATTVPRTASCSAR
jgi:hypothetical protein